VDDRLRPLWDFGDLDASERRFRELLDRETSPEGRAEVLTQLARVEGLRGRVADADRLLDEAEASATNAAASARVLLERGRVRRSSGDEQAALPLFEAAFEQAMNSGATFLAADAAHMAALCAAQPDGVAFWTERGLAVAAESPAASYWAGPLLNNRGWACYERGEFGAALDAFERALEARERRPEQPAEIEVARYAVGKTLRALGRPAEAAALLERAVAWAEETGEPDGWFHEELAEDYAALGRLDEAAEHARRALPLLREADPSFAADTERDARLRALAGGVAARPRSGPVEGCGEPGGSSA
jgi:tetratricopeptide (TPR) repeat protein